MAAATVTAALLAASPAGSTPPRGGSRPSSHAASASPSDRAPTEAYLTAVYDYAQTSLANAPATRGAIESWAGRVGAECPGVLKGAPPQAPSGTPSARRAGESEREDEQLGELESELGRAGDLTDEQADRQALLAFAAATRTLRWSNPAVMRYVSAEDASLETDLAQPVPDVCADMQAWVASGYRTLSAATKAWRSRQEAEAKRDLTGSTGRLSPPHTGDAAERSLQAQVEQLYKQERSALDLEGIFRRLEEAVGITPVESSPTVSHPHKGATVPKKDRLKYLKGGIRTLVRSRVPNGPGFSIAGEAYRFYGRIHFALSIRIRSGYSGGGGESPSGMRQGLFSWTLWRACQPNPGAAVLYGVLKRPADMVLVRTTSGALHTMKRVPLPANLHEAGVLVYAATTTAPSEVVVGNKAGKTILAENLTQQSRRATERCEGEAEGTEQPARKASAR